jgi:hypothetical protein
LLGAKNLPTFLLVSFITLQYFEQQLSLEWQVLEAEKNDFPHSLEAVDITDPDKQEYWSKYKYDIPVLHINDLYWAKHRLTPDEAKKGLLAAEKGLFTNPMEGEPDAGALERRQAERQTQN